MKEQIINEILSVVGMFITGGFGYLVARSQNKKDVIINSRQSLSEDERQFRSELKDMMLTYQQQVKDLSVEVDKLTKANRALEVQVFELTVKNENLEKQVHMLTEVNERLREELQQYQKRVTKYEGKET